MTQAWIGALCLLFIGAITPGPNNLVVMAAGTRGGFRAAFPAIFGVVVGGMAVLEFVARGAQAAIHAVPGAVSALTLAACAYLMWLGLTLIANSSPTRSSRRTAATRTLPTGFVGLVAFQFLNPKSWIMAIAVTSTGLPTPMLQALFCVVSALCLGAWCALGQTMARHLVKPGFKLWFDRAMGIVFTLSAGLLALPMIGAA